MSRIAKIPLVNSRSGASSAARRANHIAVKLDGLKASGIASRIGVESTVPVSHTSAAAKANLSPITPEEEMPEPSSPVCYAKEFKDW